MALLALLFVCFSSVILVPSPAQSFNDSNQKVSRSLVLYDDFNGPTINPAKWSDFSRLNQGSMEIVRELAPPYQGEGNNGRLHLMQHAYSWPWNDDGETYGYVGFSIANTAPIKEVSFTLAVNIATATQCQSDPKNFSSTWAGYSGRYFNYGDGSNPDEDVSANIQLQRDSTNPTGPLIAVAIVSAGGTQAFFSSQNLGTVKLGQTAKLRAQWDPPNKQFVFQMNSNPAVSIPYNVLEATDPHYLFKGISIGHGVANCTTQPTGSAMIDVYFDNVYINPY